MKTALVSLLLATVAQAQKVNPNIPYADPAHDRQVLDIYSPPNAKNLPVKLWVRCTSRSIW